MNTDDAAYFDHSEFELQQITGTKLISAPVIGSPWQIQVVDSLLWVVDGAGDPSLHVLGAKDGTLLTSLGRKGEGPGEFATSASDIEQLPFLPGVISATDITNQALTVFDPKAFLDAAPDVIVLHGGPLVVNTTWLAPDTILGITADTARRFAYFDRAGNVKRVIGGSLLGNDSIPFQERQQATTTGFRVCAHPDGSRFVIAYYTAGVIEQFDRSGSFVGRINVPYPSEPIFAAGPNGTINFRLRRSHYMDCYATATHLFALYSGRRLSAFPAGPEQSASEFLHVFDWSGNLRQVFRLTPAIRGIAIDEENHLLYGVSNVDASIYRYALPSDTMRF